MPRVRAVLVVGLTLALVLAAIAASTKEPGLRSRVIVTAGTDSSPTTFGVDSAPPSEPASLLYFQGRATVPLDGGRRMVVAEGGSVLITDERLHVSLLDIGWLGGAVLSAAPASVGRWWFSLHDGNLVLADDHGATIRTMKAPYPASYLWPARGGVLASRSPERFTFYSEPSSSPLFVQIDSDGAVHDHGILQQPAHTLLATLANAGFVATAGDTAFFARLAGSEIIAFGPRGDTLWISKPLGDLATPEPAFRLAGGRAVVDFQPYNLGLTIGPEGALYRLRAADTTATTAVIDVMDPRTGAIIGTTGIGSAKATIAVNARGRLYHVAADRILGSVAAGARASFPEFDLETRRGGRTTLAGLRGRVLLVNFWASWCGPCRTEMPALDSLRRRLAGDDFAFLALNVDIDRNDADRFADRFGFGFPILYGGPAMEAQFHYPGLPYTVLVDREGRVVRRWIGQLSRQDFDLIGFLVGTERRAVVTDHSHHHGP